MRVLENCLPRNDIVRELAPYLQHAHQEEQPTTQDRERPPRAHDDASRPPQRQTPRIGQSTSSGEIDVVITSGIDSITVNYHDGTQAILESSNNIPVSTNEGQERSTALSGRNGYFNSMHLPTLTNSQKRMPIVRSTRSEQTEYSKCSSPVNNTSDTQSGPIRLTTGGYEGGLNPHLTLASNCMSDPSLPTLPLRRPSHQKVKTELGDLTPVYWDKIVLVQVTAEGFREILSRYNSELLEEARLLYEHTVLSRLSSEYGGIELIRQRQSGLYVVAFMSEFHAAKWCISLQLSLVYAAWNVKLLKQIRALDEYYQKVPGKSKKSVLLYRGFRVCMVIHSVQMDGNLEISLANAVKWTKTVSDFAHGGQIVLSDNVWDRLKEQLVQIGNPVVEDLGAHLVLGTEVQLVLLLPRNLELRRFRPLKSPQQLKLGMRDAPSAMNDVTMVFTFIDGARPLVRSHAEELANRIKVLCSVARDLLKKHKGYECQELQGDFMVAFFHPCSAILWCGELQLQIQAKFREWSAAAGRNQQELMFHMSMGIETGRPASVSPHKTSGRADYFGNIVNQTARIAKAANGGQILIGGDAWRIFSHAYARISTNVTTHDVISEVREATIFEFKFHGYYAFKGIAAPIGLIEAIPVDPRHMQRVVQGKVSGDGLSSLFRPPKSQQIDERSVALQHRIDVKNVPAEMWRLHHAQKNENNTIRETEFDESFAIRDDVLMLESESMDEAEMTISGSETLAMSGGFRFNHNLLASQTSFTASAFEPILDERMDRI
ncbi:hypothetical protein ABG067_005180 [Albugo candida]